MKQNSSFSTEHIWCAIPVFNNKNTVKDVVLACRSYLQNVVVVDDGSADTGYLSIVLRHIT